MPSKSLNLMLLSMLLTGEVFSVFNQPDYHWTFDHADDDIIYNSESPTTDSGILSNGTSIVCDTKRYGKVAYFSGSHSGILFQNLTSRCFINPSICPSGLTFSFWINWLQFGAQPVVSSPGIVMKPLTPGTIAVEIWNGLVGWLEFHNRDIAANGIWQHYAVTWNRTAMRIHVDGVLKVLNTNSRPMKTFVETSKDARLAIGRSLSLTNTQKLVKMYMDDFQIWEKSMNSEEINAIYKQGIFNPMLYSVEDISSVIQFTAVENNPPGLIDINLRQAATYLVQSKDQCFQKCIKMPVCKSVGYKINANATSTCVIVDSFVDFTQNQRSKDGYKFHSVYR